MEMEVAARRIVDRIRSEGRVAFYAGGCVRDRLLGRRIHDIDIATDARPEEVQAWFPRTTAVGAHFGVVVVLTEAGPFEVATFRSDGAYVDGRRPETVEFATAEGDALRRDFTVNGLFLDPSTEEVIDYVGGQGDLEARLVRAIGDPGQRFAEDKLRLLRAVRFAAALDFEIEGNTWAAVQEMAPEVRVVSTERIRDELVKIFTAPSRVRGLDLLSASGLLAQVLPDVERLKGCDQPPEFHPEGDVFVHTRLMLGLLEGEVSVPLAFATLLHDVAKPRCRTIDETGRIRFNGHEAAGATMTDKILRELRFSNHDVACAVEMVRNHMAFKDAPQMRTAKLRRFMARETFPEEMELHRVDCLGSHGSLDIYDFLLDRRQDFASEPLIPPRLVTGADLLARGWRPGPIFREVLEAVQTRQLEGAFSTREEALAWVEENYPLSR